MKRRDFLKIGGAAFAQAGTAILLPAQTPQMQMGRQRRRESGLHPTHRSGYRGARAGPHPEHHRIQRHLSGPGAAHARGQERKRGCDQRYGCTGVGALARHVDPIGSGWSGRAGHASGACTRPAPLSAHATAGRLSLVPLARHGRSRSASGKLYRAVRLCLRRRGK